MDPVGIAVFCDDIREEVGGKISLIGCYGNDIQFSGAPFPITFPKLGIFVSVRLPQNLPTTPTQLVVYFPGDGRDSPTVKFDVPHQMPDGQSHPYSGREIDAPEEHDLDISLSFRFPVLLSPVLFKEEGFVRVRLLYGERRFRLGALKVRIVS